MKGFLRRRRRRRKRERGGGGRKEEEGEREEEEEEGERERVRETERKKTLSYQVPLSCQFFFSFFFLLWNIPYLWLLISPSFLLAPCPTPKAAGSHSATMAMAAADNAKCGSTQRAPALSRAPVHSY